MADRIIQTETLQSIANALRGGASQSDADKIAVSDFADVAGDTFRSFKELCEDTPTILTIPYGVTSIDTDKFMYDMNIKEVRMADSVVSISGSTFMGCGNLEKLTLSKSLVDISLQSFQGCKKLRKLTVPNGVKNIESSAFDSCDELAEINLPISMENIASDAFTGLPPVVINCAFSEGTVSDAPWGASAATINYDVTE